MIRRIEHTDAVAVAAIYNHYIRNTTVTFEEEEVTYEVIKTRIDTHPEGFPWLVYEWEGVVVGYAYATQWKGRSAYRNTCETTVYLHPRQVKKGIGSKLYEVLITKLKDAGFHTAIGGIALPNDKSVALHEKFGFQKVAHFEEVGYKMERWIDVGYWQLML